MPLDHFYTMVQKSQKWSKTQIKGGGGPARKALTKHFYSQRFTLNSTISHAQ